MRILFLLSIIVTLPVAATDLEREKRWIEETVDFIFDGEAVYLNAEGHEFLTIYTESETPSDKGIIVLHGTGFHPDWEQVVRPVRVEMTQHGWNTLSIQLPLLDKSADYEDYDSLYPEVPPRMKAAYDYLANLGNSTVIVVAHSQGATMASYYLAHHDHGIKAAVLIGMSAQHIDLGINSAESLKKISIPVLDIYGSKDFPAVLATSERRLKSAAHNNSYSQIVIENAYHFFDEHQEELLDTTRNWLEENL